MACKTRDLNYKIEINLQKKIKDNYKTNIFSRKKNKCRVIRLYEAESLTNQKSKDKIKKKNQLHKRI